jgi:hypothetical protein
MLVSIVDINACLFQGTDVLEKVGGLHNFMNWKRAMLTVGCMMSILLRVYFVKRPSDNISFCRTVVAFKWFHY